MGEYDLESETDCFNNCAPKPINVKPKKITIHPDYSKESLFASDIAIIEIDSPLNFSRKKNYHISMTCLNVILNRH